MLFDHAIDGLRLFWQLSFWGRYDLQIQVCESVVGHLPDGLNLVDSLWGWADAERCLGRYGQALALHRRALAVCEAINNPRALSGAVTHLGILASMQGQFDDAIGWYEQALKIARAIHDPQREAIALGNMTIAYKNAGNLEAALEVGLAGLDLDRQLHDLEGLSNNLGNVGNVYHRLGDFDRAVEMHGEALRMSRDIGNRQMEANDLKNLGISRLRQALRHLGDALKLFQEIGYEEGVRTTREALARIRPDAYEL